MRIATTRRKETEYLQRVGRITAGALAAFGLITASACLLGAGALASTEPQGTKSWDAAPGAGVSLVPLLSGGQAGSCMQVTTRTVTATSTQTSRACPSPSTSTSPIYAETCDDGSKEEGPVVFLLTTSEVASVSIEGGARVPTATNPTLPDGLRAATLQRAGDERVPGLQRHCPAVAAFDASGATIPMQGDGAGIPMTSELPTTIWEHPGRPPRHPCNLDATRLRRGTVAWDGTVARRITPVRGLVGHALLSCADTIYVHQGGEYITAAILLDAADPGRTPPPLPGMRALAGHPGIFLAPSSEGTILGRRIPHAWLVASEETPQGLAVPLALLEHLRATIQL